MKNLNFKIFEVNIRPNLIQSNLDLLKKNLIGLILKFKLKINNYYGLIFKINK